jgi:K+:H+ antiporter
MRSLFEKGAFEVVLLELEAGLEIARQALLYLDIPAANIQNYIDSTRQKHHTPAQITQGNGNTLTHLKNVQNLIEITWARIEGDSPFVAKSLKDLDIRRKIGISIVGVLRNDIFRPNQDAEYTFANGDLVAVMGNKHQRKTFLELVIP